VRCFCLRADGLEQIESPLLLGVWRGGLSGGGRLRSEARTARDITDDASQIVHSEQRAAFVMYAVQGRSWVSLGDPVGPDDQRIDLIWNYLELVERADGWPVFYQVDEQHLPLDLEEGLDMLKLGEEARVPLDAFTLDAKEREELSETHDTVRREHCRLEILPPERIPGFWAEFQGISDAWLAQRQLVEKRFSLASFQAAYLSRFPCAIVRQGGRVIAFANLWLGAEKDATLIAGKTMTPGPAQARGTRQ